MITEIAEFDVKPGTEDQFEAAVAQAVPLFRAAHGCRSMRLEASLEHPSRYRLFVGWNTVDDHMTGFRDSPAFTRWRELVGPFFAGPPRVEHTRVALSGF